MKTKLAVVVAVSLTMGASGAAQAQARSHLGPQLGYNFDYEAVVLGGQFSAPIGENFEIYPSVNFFFVSPGTRVAFNLDVKYRVPMERAHWLYVGGGLNIMHWSYAGSSNNHAGVNLIAGIETRSGNMHPFGEFRLTAGRETTVQLVGGLNYTLGGH